MPIDMHAVGLVQRRRSSGFSLGSLLKGRRSNQCPEEESPLTIGRGWHHKLLPGFHNGAQDEKHCSSTSGGETGYTGPPTVCGSIFFESGAPSTSMALFRPDLKAEISLLDADLKSSYEKTRETKPLDLGSLRAGGATWGLMMTEDAELIRRRGRWISSKTMEIYIQELFASTFLMSLDPDVRNNILYLAKCFPLLLQQSLQFHRAGIPQTAWRFLYSQAERVSGQSGGRTG